MSGGVQEAIEKARGTHALERAGGARVSRVAVQILEVVRCWDRMSKRGRCRWFRGHAAT